MRRVVLLFSLIIILAAILRLFHLGKTPLALEWDEVAIGYDAYSVLHTLKDQFGDFLPLTFRSLDDYKPPIYEYLTILPVAFFGLNEYSVRFPSSIAGILTVILTFFLSKRLLSNIISDKNTVLKISLIATFLSAISPWHLQFSRTAFEVNVSLLIIVFAVLSFLKGLNNKKFFFLSSVLFGLSLFSYHSARVFSPLFLVSLFVLFNKKLANKKNCLIYWGIFSIFFIIFLPILLSNEAQIRFRATNIFTPAARYLDEKDLPQILLTKRLQDNKAGFDLAGRIFHNNRLVFLDYDTIKKAVNKFLINFDFEYLFIKGDAPLHHAPGFGHLYLWQLPFILIGFYYLFFINYSRFSLLIVLWMVYAVLPDAITREAPHAVRTLLILPTYQLISALGLIYIIGKIKKESTWVFLGIKILLCIILTVNFAYYLHQYYIHTNYELSKQWMYGRKETVNYTESVKDKYDKVLVSINVDMPYIFWLFYSKYPPEEYLAGGGTVSGGFADERNRFDKYEFRNFNYRELEVDKRYLLVGIPKDFPVDAKVLKTIYYLDGSIALVIAENKIQ